MKQSSQHTLLNHYILCWVEQNLKTGASVADLIELTGYSRSAVEYVFTEEFGLCLGMYLFRRRMTRAAVMLRLSSLTITEIAESFRYYSGPNFSRAFKSYFDKSPTTYRNTPTWDRTVLQMPLEYRSPDFQAEVFDFKTSHFICGQEFKCAVGTGFDTVNDRRFIAKLSRCAKIHNHTGADTVWIASTITDSDDLLLNRQGLINLKTVTGDITEHGSGYAAEVPSGKYAMFSFTGLWEEFLFFLRQTLTKPVAGHFGSWLGHSFFIKAIYPEGDSQVLDFRLFIPVA